MADLEMFRNEIAKIIRGGISQFNGEIARNKIELAKKNF